MKTDEFLADPSLGNGDDLLTGELRNIASMSRRLAAYFIDRLLAILLLLLLVAVFVLGIYAVVALEKSNMSSSLMGETVLYDFLIALQLSVVRFSFHVMVTLLTLFLYADRLLFAVILRMSNGSSPGKRLLGLRVVRLDETPLGWGMCLMREVVMKNLANQLCLGLFLPASFIYGCKHQQQQTLQDLVVKTVVIKESKEN